MYELLYELESWVRKPSENIHEYSIRGYSTTDNIRIDLSAELPSGKKFNLSRIYSRRYRHIKIAVIDMIQQFEKEIPHERPN